MSNDKNGFQAHTSSNAEDPQQMKRYTSRFWLQTLVGGFVAAALIAAWVIGYLQPILQKKQEIAELEVRKLLLENDIQKNQNMLQQQENEQIAKALGDENESIKEDLISLAAKNRDIHNALADAESRVTELQSLLEKLAGEYNMLAQTHELAERDRDQFLDLARRTDEQVKILKQDIRRLRTAQEDTQVRSERITEQLSALTGVRTIWVTVSDPSGIPLSGIYLDRIPDGASKKEPLEHRTDSRGRKRIRVQDGDQICTQETHEFRSVCRTIEPGTTEITLHLERK